VSVVELTTERLNAVVTIVRDLELSEFPHSDAKEVLLQIKAILDTRLASLEKIKTFTDEKVANNICKQCLHTIFTIFPLLGFILRSTNVRNSFELHGPLLRIVKKGFSSDDARLIISSEWDYSPFTDQYPSHLGLDNVVFIGMPASEAGNCLSIPLTGHELGHNLWSKYNTSDHFEKVIEDNIVDHIQNNIWSDFTAIFTDLTDPSSLKDIIGKHYWAPSWRWSLRQCEELFCDFIGLFLFRESYLHAFSYLLSPGLPGNRSIYYPNICARISSITQIANKYGIGVADDYKNLFEDSEEPSNSTEKLLLGISDYVTLNLVEEIADIAHQVLVDTGLDAECNSTDINNSKYCFGIGVPIVDSASLSSIVNAAWEFQNEGMVEWKERFPSVYDDSAKKRKMLNDLVFKSIEVLEIFELQN